MIAVASGSADRSVLIVGAARGLGQSLAATYRMRGWHVIGTVRAAVPAGSRLDAPKLIGKFDVTDRQAVATLSERLSLIDLPNGGRLDLVVVAAGLLGDTSPAGLTDPAGFSDVMHTNAFAPLHLIETITTRLTDTAPVVVLSSILGSVAANEAGGYDSYRASKAALNTLLRCYAARHPERVVLALHPGWVRTAMGGTGAPLEPDASAHDLADVIARESGQPGCRFLDHKGATLPW